MYNYILNFCFVMTYFTHAEDIDFDKGMVGGMEAAPAQFPHQISLRRYGSHICGGSIISKHFVLTAAHCVSLNIIPPTSPVEGFTSWLDNIMPELLNFRERVVPADFVVYAGSTNILSGGIEIPIVEIRTHSDYKFPAYDIALLKLTRSLEFNDKIQPIRLGLRKLPPNTPLTVSGWGYLSTNGQTPMQLQHENVNVITHKECERQLNGTVPSTILCVDSPKGKGICQGDSGGPAISGGKLYGVISFTVGGCGTTNPDGLSDISGMRKWILGNVLQIKTLQIIGYDE